ncbi:GntR family transcriptional regulator [Micromonospora sp. NPDC023633]|uniref:GntR family transcriptional regulator n=1 Tax=Micromonospora sp. NPDC023633 TaxID=3154320 RepID=UPI0033DDBAFD
MTLVSGNPPPQRRGEDRASDVAYRRLRDRIIRIEYQPLEPLNEKQLSDELALGIAPIREALRRLEFDRLVTIFPRRGTFVSEIGIRDDQAVREVRLEIEGTAARLAAERATTAELSRIVELAEAARGGCKLVEQFDLDAQFHRAVYAACRNRFLEGTLSHYFNLSLRIWYFCAKSFELPASIGVHHCDTAYALRDRDGKRAEASIRRHILSNAADLSLIFSDNGL